MLLQDLYKLHGIAGRATQLKQILTGEGRESAHVGLATLTIATLFSNENVEVKLENEAWRDALEREKNRCLRILTEAGIDVKPDFPEFTEDKRREK
jgi:hypothetical protein